jgi:hypothetical protein
MKRLCSISSVLSSFGLACAVAACGDNLGSAEPDATATPDGGLDATPARRTGFVASGDFGTTGVFSTVDVAAGTVMANALAGVAGGDPYVRALGDEVLIINRDRGENITILGGSPLALVDQYGTGGGSNPQDVAVAGGKLYVPALGTAGVVVIDRATRALRTIAIAGDPDGRPDCVSAFAVDGKVFVACGLLDNFAATRPGKVAVIDVATDTVTTSFDLPARNPIGLFARGGAALGGDLLLGTAPSFTDYTSGCVVRVTTGATPAANGCLVSNQDLGGLANHIAVDPDDGTPWVAVTGYAGPGFDNPYGRLRALDRTSGVPGVVRSTAGQQIDDVAACGDGYLITADGAAGGVRIWKDGVERTTAALDIGRPTGFGNNMACR